MTEHEPFLSPLLEAGFRVSWVGRQTDVDTNVDRAEAVARLMPIHLEEAGALGVKDGYLWLCEQVHGNIVYSVSGASGGKIVLAADGLTTNDPNSLLGVYIADCGALYVGDPVKRAVSVLHSGKVGTEKNILNAGVQQMVNEYGSNPVDLIVVLGPCIRPPAYEIDFAKKIAVQAEQCGILKENYHDCEICTTSDPEKYYSYRKEKGMTGRMLALIGV